MESRNRALKKNLKNHWESLWRRQTTRGNLLQCFSNYFAKKGTEACWRMYSDLLSKCTFDLNPRILELGAGSGNMTLRILKKFGGTATLVDYSAQALRIAKQNAFMEGLADRVSFTQDDVFNFIPQKSYDLVHSAGLIEHFPMPFLEKLVRKHVECVNAQGYIIIMVPAPIWWYKAMRRFLEIVQWWPKDFEVPLNKEKLEGIAEKNGLEILQSLQSSDLVRASAILGVPGETSTTSNCNHKTQKI